MWFFYLQITAYKCRRTKRGIDLRENLHSIRGQTTTKPENKYNEIKGEKKEVHIKMKTFKPKTKHRREPSGAY